MTILLLLLVILLELKYSNSYHNYNSKTSSRLSLKSSITRFKYDKNIITKEKKKPILKLIDNKTGAKITLVGVSHGAKGITITNHYYCY